MEKIIQKWEYKIKSDLSREELNQLGGEGWELVSVTSEEYPESFQDTFYFKRKIE